MALLLCLAASASGQQNKTTIPPPGSSPFSSLPDLTDAWASGQMPDPAQGLISVDVSVTDKTGKSVSGLSEKDFTLLDNDRQQKIVTFQAIDGSIAQPANSLEIVLVIDERSTMPNPEQGEAGAAGVYRAVENFLRANGGVLAKPTMIYRFTDDGLFAMPHASMDGNELALALEQPAQQRRVWSPAMVANDIRITVEAHGAGHDAVVKAKWTARETDDSLIALGSIAIEERRRPGRKLMFWLGNGWPIEDGKATGLSDFSIELLTRMREAHINLWSALETYDLSGIATAATKADSALATDITREPPADVQRELARDVNRGLIEGPKLDATDLRYLSLPVIAMRSGGGVLDTGHNLAASLSEQVKAAGSYYLLSFDPQRTNVVDEYHHLKIAAGKPDLTAHVPEDYYDEPVFYDQEPALQSVSVKQLQSVMAGAHGISDAKLAHQLDGMRLKERLSNAKLETLERSARGKKAREALEILADKSAFFDPPDDEIIAAPPPELAVQQQLIAKAVSYINSTVPHLPDFLATRTSVQYYERMASGNQAGGSNLELLLGGVGSAIGGGSGAASGQSGANWKTAPADQSLHEAATEKADIRFRKGKELVQNESVKSVQGRQGRQHLQTIGAFGPILGTITVALTWTRSQLNWHHWEQGDDGRLAVFRYHVTQGTPFFSAGFCCLPSDNQKSIPFLESVPFHGVIALDPESGAILRLTVQADLGWRLPLERSDMMVEYGPVQGGSRIFICPSRAVSISRQRGIVAIHEWGEAFEVYAPFETVLNEMRFDHYHIFGSTSRILPGYVDAPGR